MGERSTIKTSGSSVSKNLLRAALEHAHYQLMKLEELSHQEYPFSASKHLIKILLEIHNKIIAKLDSLLKELEANPSDASLNENARIGAKRFGYLLALLHNTLQLLEFSSRTHISQASVHLIEGLTAKQLKAKKFILTPGYEYNYSYYDIMAHILKITRTAFGHSARVTSRLSNIAVLSYPEVYKENILANCLLGHEIGHFVVEQSKLVDKVMNERQFDTKLLQELVEEQKAQKIGPQQTKLTEFLSDEVIRQNIISLATSILNDWIDELASDVFAIRIMGPVFIFSLEKVLLTLEDLDDRSPDHPSARTRLQLLLDQNVKQGFIPELKMVKGDDAKLAAEIVTYFEQMQEIVSEPPNVEMRLQDKLLDAAVRGITPTMTEEVDRMIIAQRFQKYYPSMMGEDIFSMHQALQCFVPPCDDPSGAPGNIVSILNAGMAFMISGKELFYKYRDARDLKDELRAEVKIRELILKGIELSYLERHLRK